jgi:hypothetical protein
MRQREKIQKMLYRQSEAGAEVSLMPMDPADVRKAVLDADDFGHEMRVRNLLAVTPAITFEL